jgi:hypothetical protein
LNNSPGAITNVDYDFDKFRYTFPYQNVKVVVELENKNRYCFDREQHVLNGHFLSEDADLIPDLIQKTMKWKRLD